jgi:hypothetical protein
MFTKKILFNTLLYDNQSNFGYREYVRNLFFLFNKTNSTFLFRKSQKNKIEEYKLNNNLIFNCIYIDDFCWRIKLIAISFFLKEKYDVYIHTFNYGPLITRGKNICVVHDLQFRHSAFKNSYAFKFQRNIFLKHHFFKYDGFIFISNYSRYDFILKYGQRRNLFVIPNFLNKKKYDICKKVEEINDCKYFLCVSSSLWYKNLNYLISEFEETNKTLAKDSLGQYKLVLVSDLKIKNENIIVLENLSQSQLNFIYENAEIIIIPSIFEGFCFPYVESSIFNKPLIANNIPIAKEIRDNMKTKYFENKTGDLSSAIIDVVSNYNEFNDNDISKIDRYINKDFQIKMYDDLIKMIS